MPRAKKIDSPYDIMDREGYKEIIELLRKEKRAMTVIEIRDKLFPVGSRNEKKPQTVQVFLKYLVTTDLVVKNPGDKYNNIRTTYEAVPEDVFLELRGEELIKKITRSKESVLLNLDKLNQILTKWNQPGAGPGPDKEKFMRDLVFAQPYITYDKSSDRLKLDCEVFLNAFPTPKEAIPSIQDFIEYKLEPAKKELENFFTILSKHSKIKITVEYGDGEKVEIS